MKTQVLILDDKGSCANSTYSLEFPVFFTVFVLSCDGYEFSLMGWDNFNSVFYPINRQWLLHIGKCGFIWSSYCF